MNIKNMSFFSGFVDNVLGTLTNVASYYINILKGFFTGDNALDNIIKVVVLYVFFIWVSLVIWVAKDITNRTTNVAFQILCVLIVLFGTPLGVFIYLLIRPRSTIFERFYEESEFELLEGEEAAAYHAQCFSCGYPIQEDYKICPHCQAQLLKNCSNCSRIIKVGWKTCPYCGFDEKGNKLRLKSTPQESTSENTKLLSGNQQNSLQKALDNQEQKSNRMLADMEKHIYSLKTEVQKKIETLSKKIDNLEKFKNLKSEKGNGSTKKLPKV